MSSHVDEGMDRKYGLETKIKSGNAPFAKATTKLATVSLVETLPE